MFHSLNHFKFVTINQFYVKPADGNYILARWMPMNGLQQELFWQVAQCLEKYMKAALILNGRQVGTLGHKLDELYDAHLATCGTLAFREFSKPEGLDDSLWKQQNVKDAIDRIAILGSPDSRYGMVSWGRLRDDLFKIDQLAFHLRRLIICFEWKAGEDWPLPDNLLSFEGFDYGDILLMHPRLTLLDDPAIDRSTSHKIHEFKDREDILRRGNFEFGNLDIEAGVKVPTRAVPLIGPFSNSLLYSIAEAMQSSDDPIMRTGIEWMIECVPMSKGLRGELKSLLSR